VRGIATRRDDEFERQRALSHEVAGLICVGFHDPKKLPKYEPLKKVGQPIGEPTQVDDAKIRGYFMFQAMRSKS